MDVWPWICDLLNSSEWNQSNSQSIYQLASSNTTTTKGNPTQSIQLKAERSSELKQEVWITFSIIVEGFYLNESKKIIWLSDPCPLSSNKPFLPLVQQLVQETINRAPITYHDHIHHGSQHMKVKSDPIVWILETFSPESFSSFFSLLLFTRLFWLCACDAPSEVGSLYFHSLFAPNLEIMSRASHMPVLKGFMMAAGIDVEMCISRAVGYMLAKWLITREMRVGLSSLLPLPSNNLGISYASEACNLWLLKAYAPIWAMKRTCSSETNEGFNFVGPKESALKYSLAHQQLEAHIQLEYNVVFLEGHIQVSARVDNIRLHVVKLGFNINEDNSNNKEVEFGEELYFPSRVEFWVGPEIGSNYVSSLSLGKSTINTEREVKTQKIVKGSFGKTKSPKVKSMSRNSTRMKMKNWRCDQDVEGNVAIFDSVFYDNTNGIEVYSTKLIGGGGGGGGANKPTDDLGKRYSRVNRPFMKSGGLVFSGDEYVEEVKWRLSKEMEGSVLKWRFGSKIWVTYWPSDVESSFYETRAIEWSHEVDLPLINYNVNKTI